MGVSGLRNTSGNSGQWRLRSSCTGWGLGHDPAADLSFVVVAFEVSGVAVHSIEPLVGFGLGCFQPFQAFVDQPGFLLGELDELGEAAGPLQSKPMGLDCLSPRGVSAMVWAKPSFC